MKKILAVINLAEATGRAFEPFSGGKSAYEHVCDVLESLPGFAGAIALVRPDHAPEGTLRQPTRTRDRWDMKAVFEETAAYAAAEPDADAILYAYGDAPFLDAALALKLLSVHERYHSEYSFSDGYPAGFTLEILSPRVLPNLVLLSGKHEIPLSRDGVFALVQKDINSFDIETDLSPVDLREYRFSPTCDTLRNAMSARRLRDLGALDAGDALRILPDNLGLLRNRPAFLWVQVAEGCPQSCSCCPWPAMAGDPRLLGGYMPVERFDRLVSEAVAFSGDLVVDISLWGDPARHPDPGALVRAVLAHADATLIVETAGIGWDRALLESLAVEFPERLHWVVSLDEPEAAAYGKLRGDGFEEAVATAEALVRLFPGTAYVQAVRMDLNESRLESFYRGWKARTERIIIQKYDSFCGALPRRIVADLSPLDRRPCVHLARDMSVLLDGSVPACRHCLVTDARARLTYAETIGNVFEDGVEAVWARGEAWYARHLGGTYPEPCGRCDEYYTFNA